MHLWQLYNHPTVLGGIEQVRDCLIRFHEDALKEKHAKDRQTYKLRLMLVRRRVVMNRFTKQISSTLGSAALQQADSAAKDVGINEEEEKLLVDIIVQWCRCQQIHTDSALMALGKAAYHTGMT